MESSKIVPPGFKVALLYGRGHEWWTEATRMYSLLELGSEVNIMNVDLIFSAEHDGVMFEANPLVLKVLNYWYEHPVAADFYLP